MKLLAMLVFCSFVCIVCFLTSHWVRFFCALTGEFIALILAEAIQLFAFNLAMAPKKSKIPSATRGGKQSAMKVMFKPSPKSITCSTTYRTKKEEVASSSHPANVAPALLPSNADVLYGILLRPGVTACGARLANEQFIQWNDLDEEIADWLRRKTEEIIEITTVS